MRALAGKVALVTGAASGIGRATAVAFAANAVRVILADIDATRLQEVASETAGLSECLLAWAGDVSNRDEMAAFAQQVHAAVPCVDILVNNAGVYLTGGPLDLSLDDWEWSLSTNLRGVIHCVHFFVPRMVEKGRGGHVVNMASMYGYWVSPGVIGYLTAKFGVFGFSEALREDLRRYGIGVSTVCPGVIATGLVGNMRMRNTNKIAGAVAPQGDEAAREKLKKMYARRNYTPERVARAIVRAVQHNGKLVLVTPEARLMYHVERVCPPLSRVVARIAAKRMFS